MTASRTGGSLGGEPGYTVQPHWDVRIRRFAPIESLRMAIDSATTRQGIRSNPTTLRCSYPSDTDRGYIVQLGSKGESQPQQHPNHRALEHLKLCDGSKEVNGKTSAIIAPATAANCTITTRSPLALSPTVTVRASPRSPRHEDRRPRSASAAPAYRHQVRRAVIPTSSTTQLPCSC